jgi:hypothetical protein
MHTVSMEESATSIVFYSEDGGNMLFVFLYSTAWPHASQKATFFIFTSVKI